MSSKSVKSKKVGKGSKGHKPGAKKAFPHVGAAVRYLAGAAAGTRTGHIESLTDDGHAVIKHADGTTAVREAGSFEPVLGTHDGSAE